MLPLLDSYANPVIGGTGTIYANRLMKCPLSDIAKLKQGAYDYAYDSSSHIEFVCWMDSMDSKPVTLVSNCNGMLSTMKVCHWSNATKSEVEIDQPFIVSFTI